MTPYRFKMLKVGEYGAVGKYYGPGLPKDGKAVIGPADLNLAYKMGRLAAKSKAKKRGGS